MPAVNEPIAVNTGPLIALSACDCLELLPKLHARIVAPEVVLKEYLRGSSASPGDARVHPEWLQVLALANAPSATLVKQLDAGESAVIALAIERQSRLRPSTSAAAESWLGRSACASPAAWAFCCGQSAKGWWARSRVASTPCASMVSG